MPTRLVRNCGKEVYRSLCYHHQVEYQPSLFVYLPCAQGLSLTDVSSHEQEHGFLVFGRDYSENTAPWNIGLDLRWLQFDCYCIKSTIIPRKARKAMSQFRLRDFPTSLYQIHRDSMFCESVVQDRYRRDLPKFDWIAMGVF